MVRGVPPHDSDPAGRQALALAERWRSTVVLAGRVAQAAGTSADPGDDAAAPAALLAARGWRAHLVAEALDDLCASLRHGLAAIADAGPAAKDAARALWTEYLGARTALLALAPPGREECGGEECGGA